MTRLHERDLVALLLVRAVEDHDRAFFTPQTLSESALAAVDARSDAELLEKRTAFLFLRLPKQVRAWARVALLPEDSLGFVMLAAFLLGVASNYLGPTGFVHVAYNPLSLLIVWNLGVYLLLGWRWLGREETSSEDLVVPVHAAPAPVSDADADDERGPWWERRFLPRFLSHLWFTWNRWRARLRSGGRRVAKSGRVAAEFWKSYWETASPVVTCRVELLIHAGAIGLFLGALAGTYLRGLFFEYNAVWRSTFVTEPASVATFLNSLLGPACLLVDGRLLTPDDVRPLLQPHGAIAAMWIHRLALTGALVVLLPRGILAFAAARHAKATAGRVVVDLTQGYYADKLRAAREGQIHRIREGVVTTLRLEMEKFAEAVAVFVRDRFFDKLVAPTLLSFRNKGGRIADLEGQVSAHRAAFEPEFLAFLQANQAEFERSVRAGIRSVVGKEISHGTYLSRAPSAEVAFEQRVTTSVATRLGDAIGASVTAGVAAAVATASGGVGKTVGVAVLAHLLGVGGPVGLLIGGIAALAVVGGAYLFGRDRVTEAVKGWSIPATVAAMALRDARIDAAREDTYSKVKEEVRGALQPQVGAATELILQHLALAVADVSRADAPPAAPPEQSVADGSKHG